MEYNDDKEEISEAELLKGREKYGDLKENQLKVRLQEMNVGSEIDDHEKSYYLDLYLEAINKTPKNSLTENESIREKEEITSLKFNKIKRKRSEESNFEIINTSQRVIPKNENKIEISQIKNFKSKLDESSLSDIQNNKLSHKSGLYKIIDIKNKTNNNNGNSKIHEKNIIKSNIKSTSIKINSAIKNVNIEEKIFSPISFNSLYTADVNNANEFEDRNYQKNPTTKVLNFSTNNDLISKLNENYPKIINQIEDHFAGDNPIENKDDSHNEENGSIFKVFVTKKYNEFSNISNQLEEINKEENEVECTYRDNCNEIEFQHSSDVNFKTNYNSHILKNKTIKNSISSVEHNIQKRKDEDQYAKKEIFFNNIEVGSGKVINRSQNNDYELNHPVKDLFCANEDDNGYYKLTTINNINPSCKNQNESVKNFPNSSEKYIQELKISRENNNIKDDITLNEIIIKDPKSNNNIPKLKFNFGNFNSHSDQKISINQSNKSCLLQNNKIIFNPPNIHPYKNNNSIHSNNSHLEINIPESSPTTNKNNQTSIFISEEDLYNKIKNNKLLVTLLLINGVLVYVLYKFFESKLIESNIEPKTAVFISIGVISLFLFIILIKKHRMYKENENLLIAENSVNDIKSFLKNRKQPYILEDAFLEHYCIMNNCQVDIFKNTILSIMKELIKFDSLIEESQIVLNDCPKTIWKLKI